ncbi:hypothetical protein AMTRI_Chr03g141260 [Amborella trichopoda]
MKFNMGLLLTFLPLLSPPLEPHCLTPSSPLKPLGLLSPLKTNPFAAFKERNIGKRYRVELDIAISNRKCEKQLQVMKGQWA